MAGKTQKGLFYNLIAIAVLGVLLVLSLMGCGSLTSVALDQEVRCGMAEHLHSQDCYIGEVLICGQKAHTHSENCYLLLLQNNDINWLLATVDKTEDKSLETVINTVVIQAIAQDGNVTQSPETSLLELTASDISSLNNTISNNSISTLVLNENLENGTTLAVNTGEGGTVSTLAAISSDVKSAIVEEATNDNDNRANFYVYFIDEDGNKGWAYIGTETFSPVSSSNYGGGTTYYAITTDTVLSVINEALNLEDDYTRTALPQPYYTTADNDDWNKTGSFSKNPYGSSQRTYYTSFGTRSFYNYDSSARYIYIGAGSSSSAEGNTKFCRVTYDYSDYPNGGTNNTTYYTVGTTIALPTLADGYIWQDQDGNRYLAGQSVTLSKSLVLTPVLNKYTVTFESNCDTAVASQEFEPSVPEANRKVTKPADPTRTGYTFGGWYTDAACTNAYNFSSTVNGSFTLYAKWTLNTYTVTYTYVNATGGSTQKSITVNHGGTVKLDEAYSWDGYADGAEITVTSDMNFTGKIKTYTVTIVDENGKTVDTQTVEHGGKPALPNLGDGLFWVRSDGKAVGDPIRSDVTFTASTSVTATYNYANGTTGYSDPVAPGEKITLPDISNTHRWVDENGNSYSGGDTVTLNTPMTFTEKTTMQVSYTVNFPTGSTGFYGATYPASPTIIGTNGATEVEDTVVQDSITSVRDISDYKPTSATKTHAVTFYHSTYFQGWLTETGVLLSPGTNLSWDMLSAYDADNDGVVELEGQWASAAVKNAVNFCIHYTSELVGSGGDASDYTPSLFGTYMGGTIDTSYRENAEDGKDAYEADKRIRSLANVKESGMWMYDFPSDEEIFASLKKYIGSLYVDGELVETSELSSKYYAIRWSVIFLDGADGWHVDGRLVRRKGQITIDKQFLGDGDAVAAAESGSFSIVAQNGTYDEETGTFTPYASDNDLYRKETLYLNTADDSDTANNSYEWVISDVELGEYWQITEYTDKVTVNDTEYIYYAEYSVKDTDGNSTAIAEYGTVASVIGKTYALDEDANQGLLVDFRNYYYPADTLLLKKEDALTGDPIGGAVFELWQKNSEGTPVRLSFSQTPDGSYAYDDRGTIHTISTGATGYSNITLTGFSFEHGNVIVKEVTAPGGYDLAPNVEITSKKAANDSTDILVIKSIYYENGDAVAGTEWSGYAEVSPDEMVLVVKDRSTKTTSVTAKKEWGAADSAEDKVTVTLQANGSRATNTFPSLSNIEVTLDANGAYVQTDSDGKPIYLSNTPWSFTWSDLPCYANGELVEWSIKEIKVGEAPTLADNESFANWIPVYVPAAKTDSNADGITDNWYCLVTNHLRRTMLNVTKTDQSGTPLPGAVFSLVECNVNGTPVSNAVTDTQTSGDNGMLVFDALTAGKYYLLTEISAPAGYTPLLEPIVLTITGDGLVQTVDAGGTKTGLTGDVISYTGVYSVHVVNISLEPLPETGGFGTSIYTQAGLLLMLAALVLLLYKMLHRREGDSPYV